MTQVRQHLRRFIDAFLAVAVGSIVYACGDVSRPLPTLSVGIVEECPSAADDEYYFPREAISPSPILDASRRKWFSRLLTAADAPSLSCGARDVEAYRLIWLPPPSQPALVIAVTKTDGGWSLAATEYAITTFQEPMRVTRTTRRQLSPDATAPLLSDLRDGGFWSTLAWRRSSVEDGWGWAVEGRMSKNYRIVTRVNSDPELFKTLATKFFTLAGLAVPDRPN
jgi:hypothetical protein